MLKLSQNALGMLIARYRAVFKKCLLKNAAMLAAAGLICCAAPAAAQVDYYDSATTTTTSYADLEDLRTSVSSFNDNDKITMYDNDNSLTGELSFSGKSVTIDFQDKAITIVPSTTGEYFLSLSGDIVTFANASQAIISGFERSVSNYGGTGGAIAATGSTLNAESATFEYNSVSTSASDGYGGAIYATSSMLNTNNATFESNCVSVNTSSGYGGAVSLHNGSELNVKGATFDSNFVSASSHGSGGAVYAIGSTLNAEGATFDSNFVSVSGSYGFGEGGAVSLHNGSELNAEGATFVSNFVSVSGSNPYGYGGAVYASYSTVSAEGATFKSNRASASDFGAGGAVFLDIGGTLNARNANFLNNTASHYGGAIYAVSYYSQTTINLDTDAGKISTFSENTASGQANSIYFSGYSDGTNDGKIVLTVDGAGTLDMLDPMTSKSDEYNIDVTKTGIGTWKLTGDNEFNANGSTGTTFAVEQGTLELYQDANITISKGSFTVGDNATLSLVAGTSPAIVTESVDFGSLSSLNIGGYSGSQEGDTVTLIQSANVITNMTNHYTIGGNTGVDYLSALVHLSDDKKEVLADVALTWYDNHQDLLSNEYDKAHGTFTIDGADNSFTLGTGLEDRTGIFTINNWDGETLTKAGAGTLILTGNNTYTGDTIIEEGTLTIENVNSLSSASDIKNNSMLNLFASSTDSTTYNIKSYSGSATSVVGIKASLTAQDQWSDLLNFSSTPESVNVHFYFADGSSTDYLSEDGLQFAHLSTADGTDSTFALSGFSSLAGASELGITTSDYQDYYLTATFNPSLGKVYPEASAAQLSQASWMHNRELFKVAEQASRQADKHITGIAVGFNRNDYRQETGSHANIDGNSLAMAMAFKANDETTWGIFGQKFDGSYKTSHTATLASGPYTVRSDGDLDTHEIGLFAEYRPIREAESSYYYQAFISAGRSTNKFLANNASTTISGVSSFKSGRDLFAASVGGGYIVNTAPGETTDYYSHLIYTRLGSDSISDSIGQRIKLESSDSVRLLSGVKFNFNQDRQTQTYFGVALDYEFSGKTNAYIGGLKADSANIKGLTGILEFGLTARQSDTLTIDLGLQGYMGKKEGLGGMVTVSTKF